MEFSNEFLQGSLLTEESIRADLEELRGYYKDMGIEAELLPVNEMFPLPSLVAGVLPEDGDEEDFLAITNSFLPLGEEEAEFTKYLQTYAELKAPTGEVDRTILLEAVCRLNQALPMGHCVLTQDGRAAVRSVQGFPIEEPIDQGVFTEDTILFELSCDLAATVVDELQEGKSLDEAFSVIGL